MRQQLIPQLAEIIAKDQHTEVYRNHEIVEQLDVAKIEVIDSIINSLRMGRRRPDHQKEIQEILTAKSDNKKEIRIIADLFLTLYYNPFYPKKYAHAFTKRIMDLEEEALIGEDMWNKLGGEGTYDELLSIIEEVKAWRSS